MTRTTAWCRMRTRRRGVLLWRSVLVLIVIMLVRRRRECLQAMERVRVEGASRCLVVPRIVRRWNRLPAPRWARRWARLGRRRLSLCLSVPWCIVVVVVILVSCCRDCLQPREAFRVHRLQAAARGGTARASGSHGRGHKRAEREAPDFSERGSRKRLDAVLAALQTCRFWEKF